MKFSTARSERITATISTVVAVAILAGGVTAYQSHNKPVDDVVQLESDFRFQLEVGFRHDAQERAARLTQLETVTQAWQSVPASTSNREKMAKWLLEATIRSMPGSIEPLPAVPKFTAEPSEAAAEPSPRPVVTPSTSNPAVESIVEPVFSTPTRVSAPVTRVTTPPAHTDATTRGQLSAQERTLGPVAGTMAGSTARTQPMNATKVARKAPVQINLTELAARIAGYHQGLDEIERAVSSLAADDFLGWSEQLGRLEELTVDYGFIKLYYGALTNRERQAVGSPRPLTATLAEIERRIDRVQESLAGDFLGEFDATREDRVGELRQHLANISDRLNR